MECECCGRKQEELVIDTFIRDSRDFSGDGNFGEYIVCTSCVALEDDAFFELMSMDRCIPVAERYAALG